MPSGSYPFRTLLTVVPAAIAAAGCAPAELHCSGWATSACEASWNCKDGTTHELTCELLDGGDDGGYDRPIACQCRIDGGVTHAFVPGNSTRSYGERWCGADDGEARCAANYYCGWNMDYCGYPK